MQKEVELENESTKWRQTSEIEVAYIAFLEHLKADEKCVTRGSEDSQAAAASRIEAWAV